MTNQISIVKLRHTCQRPSPHPRWPHHPPDHMNLGEWVHQITQWFTIWHPNLPKPTIWLVFIAKQIILEEFLTLNHLRMPWRMQNLFISHTIIVSSEFTWSFSTKFPLLLYWKCFNTLFYVEQVVNAFSPPPPFDLVGGGWGVFMSPYSNAGGWQVWYGYISKPQLHH